MGTEMQSVKYYINIDNHIDYGGAMYHVVIARSTNDQESTVLLNGESYVVGSSWQFLYKQLEANQEMRVRVKDSNTQAIAIESPCYGEIAKDNDYILSKYGIWDRPLGDDSYTRGVDIICENPDPPKSDGNDETKDPVDTQSRWTVKRGKNLNLSESEISNSSYYVVMSKSDRRSAVMANGFSKFADDEWMVSHKLSMIEFLNLENFGSTRSVIQAIPESDFVSLSDNQIIDKYLGDVSDLEDDSNDIHEDEYKQEKLLGDRNNLITLTSPENKEYIIIAKGDVESSITLDDSIRLAVGTKWSIIKRLTTPESISIKSWGTTKTILSSIRVEDKEKSDTELIEKYGGYSGIKEGTPDGDEYPVDTNQVLIVQTDGEDITSLTNEQLMEKYNEQIHRQRVKEKELEIEDLQYKIDKVWLGVYDDNGNLVEEGKLGKLRNKLDIYQNFTKEQLIERNRFVIEREWKDDQEHDSERLLKNAKDKFEELRLPKDVLTINIVDFFDIATERKNWDKLEIGDTVLIRYEKLGISVKAKIIEIDYNFEKNNIKLKIANVQDLNGVSNDWLKTLYESISTSTTVDSNKWKWDGIEVTNGKVNAMIEDLWSEIGGIIKAGNRQDVQITDRGIWIKAPEDPKKMLVAKNAVLAISDDGGNSWKHAITYRGVVGERLFGKQILGVNLIIEHEDGIFRVDKEGVTIDGQHLNIIGGGMAVSDLIDMGDFYEQVQDTISDKFTKLEGLVHGLDADLDLEGVILEDVTYNGVKISSEHGIQVMGYKPDDFVDGEPTVFHPASLISLNGARGIEIWQNPLYEEGGVEWEQTFWVDTKGTLMTRNMKAHNLMIEDEKDGYFLFDGNHMVVTNRHKGDDVAHFGVLNPMIGGIDREDLGLLVKSRRSRLYATRDKNFTLEARQSTGWEKVFWVEDDGTVYAKNVYAENIKMLTKKSKELEELLGKEKPAIDLEGSVLDLTMFDTVIASNMEVEDLRAIRVTADYGMIRDLTVNKLVTNDTQKSEGETNDYISIEEHEISFLTGTHAGYGEQHVTSTGLPLYEDAEGRYTTEVTDNPVYEELWDEVSKMKITFAEDGTDKIPRIEWGIGANDGTNKGRGFMYKKSWGMLIQYFDALNSHARNIKLYDGGIKLSVTDGSGAEVGYIDLKEDGIVIKSNGDVQFDVPPATTE